MLTKKDFKAIAEIIKSANDTDRCGNRDFDSGWDAAVKRIGRKSANYFATQNPNFNWQKFLDACGL